MLNQLRFVTVIGLLALSFGVHAEEQTRVFAAASSTNALNDVGGAVEAKRDIRRRASRSPHRRRLPNRSTRARRRTSSRRRI